jgi:fluoride ion exporter CrcB/FEX
VSSFLLEFWDFLRARKKFWLFPTILLALVLGGLVVLTHGSAIAPFIYTLF